MCYPLSMHASFTTELTSNKVNRSGCNAYWTISRQTNSQSAKSRTSQLADSNILITKRPHYIPTLKPESIPNHNPIDY